MTGAARPGLVFWPGSRVDLAFAELLVAARSGDHDALALSPLMIDRLLGAGRTAADIVDQAAVAGISLTQLDGVSSWAPIACAADAPEPIRARFAFGAERCLDMAAALGMTTVLAAGAFERDAVATDRLVDGFARFCDAAADRGLRVDLEFVPFWGIPSLGAAWNIVRAVDRPNAGIMVDTWHLVKGSVDFERDMALLAVLPGERLTNVQLADAPWAREAGTLYAEGRCRRFPGDGELPLERIVRTIFDKGHLAAIGSEIFGGAIDALSPEAAGARAGRSVDAILDNVVPPVAAAGA